MFKVIGALFAVVCFGVASSGYVWIVRESFAAMGLRGLILSVAPAVIWCAWMVRTSWEESQRRYREDRIHPEIAAQRAERASLSDILPQWDRSPESMPLGDYDAFLDTLSREDFEAHGLKYGRNPKTK